LLTVLSVLVSNADWKKEEKMTNAYHSIFDLLQDQLQTCGHWFSLCVLIPMKKTFVAEKICHLTSSYFLLRLTNTLFGYMSERLKLPTTK
jgi:hypothetical protein